MSRILVGTTFWTEKTLVESGRFYPPDVHTAEARLRYCATQFPVVEVDSSYYGLPSARNAALWVERTPDGFVFDVKAFRLFTQHRKDVVYDNSVICERLDALVPDPKLIAADGPARLTNSGVQSQ